MDDTMIALQLPCLNQAGKIQAVTSRAQRMMRKTVLSRMQINAYSEWMHDADLLAPSRSRWLSCAD
jgi:hypothetical protein